MSKEKNRETKTLPVFQLETQFEIWNTDMNSDKITRLVLSLGSFILIIVAAGMIYSLVIGSIPAFQTFGFKFIFSNNWDPTYGKENYGALPFIAGTLISSILALLISLPLSFSTSLFLGEYS